MQDRDQLRTAKAMKSFFSRFENDSSCNIAGLPVKVRGVDEYMLVAQPSFKRMVCTAVFGMKVTAVTSCRWKT
jgi:hypothetical protein